MSALRSALLWQLQPLGRPVLSTGVACVVYGLVVPYWLTGAAALCYVAFKLLQVAQGTIGVRLALADLHGALVLAYWLPCALPSLLVLLCPSAATVR